MRSLGHAFVEVGPDHLRICPFEHMEIGQRFWFVPDEDRAIEAALLAEDWPRAEWLAGERLDRAEDLVLTRVTGRDGEEGRMQVKAQPYEEWRAETA